MKYNTIFVFGENNESCIGSRQAPVWKGLISIVLNVINSGPYNYYGIDRIPVYKGRYVQVALYHDYKLLCSISPLPVYLVVYSCT